MSKSGKTRPGNRNTKRLLGFAAVAAIRNKDTHLVAYFRRITARREANAHGSRHPQTCHRDLHVLHDHVAYRDLGADYFTKRDPERAIRRMIKEANSLGMTLRFEPIAMAS